MCGQSDKDRLIEVSFSSNNDIIHFNTASNIDFNGKTLYLGMQQMGITLKPFKEKSHLPQFNFNILHTHGALPSADYIGDLQVISNIEAGKHTGLFEAFIEQSYNKHTLILGQHDLNANFLYTEPALLFSNGSFGIMPSVSCNVGCSLYPLSTLGIIYNYEDNNKSFRFGFYDGDPGTMEHNKHNLSPSLSTDQGFLSIAEFAYNLNSKTNTMVKVGSYFHSADFSTDINPEKIYTSNYGAYFLVEHMPERVSTSGSNLHLFIKGGIVPPNRNFISSFLGAGIVANSIFNLFNGDQLGIAYAQAFISRAYQASDTNLKASEVVTELFYGVDFLKYFRLQPSVQYIVNPGAVGGVNNALVTLIRFQASL
jgi:porin